MKNSIKIFIFAFLILSCKKQDNTISNPPVVQTIHHTDKQEIVKPHDQIVCTIIDPGFLLYSNDDSIKHFFYDLDVDQDKKVDYRFTLSREKFNLYDCWMGGGTIPFSYGTRIYVSPLDSNKIANSIPMLHNFGTTIPVAMQVFNYSNMKVFFT